MDCDISSSEQCKAKWYSFFFLFISTPNVASVSNYFIKIWSISRINSICTSLSSLSLSIVGIESFAYYMNDVYFDALHPVADIGWEPCEIYCNCYICIILYWCWSCVTDCRQVEIAVKFTSCFVNGRRREYSALSLWQSHILSYKFFRFG